MRKVILALGVLATLFAFSAKAADAPSVGQGTHINAADIKAVLGKVNLKKNSDTVMAMIDAGNAHVGMAVLHRPKAAKGQAGDPMLHSALIEIYYVLEGRAVMITGGKLLDTKPVPKEAMERNSLAPSTRGGSVDPTGSESQTIGPGDIVIVPVGTVHYISEVLEDVTILVYRIDATKQNTLHAEPSPVFIP